MKYTTVPLKLFLILTLFFCATSQVKADTNSTNSVQSISPSKDKSGIFSWIPNPLNNDKKSITPKISSEIAQTSQGLTNPPEWLKDVQNLLDKYSSHLDDTQNKGKIDGRAVAEWLNKLKVAKLKSQQNIEDIAMRLEEVNKQINTLGTATDNEDEDITKKRELLLKEATVLNATEKYCHFIIIRINDTEQRLQVLGKNNFRDKMLTRQLPLWELIPAVTESPSSFLNNISSAINLFYQNIPHSFLKQISIMFLLGLIAGFWIKHKLPRHTKVIEDSNSTIIYTTALVHNFRLKIPLLLALITTGLTKYFYPELQNTVFQNILLTTILYIITFTFLKALLCTSTTSSIFSKWPPKQSQILYRLLHTTCILFIGGYIFYWLGIHHYLADEQRHLLISIILIILSINMISNLSWILHTTSKNHIHFITNSTMIALIATLIFEVVGFHILAFLILKITLGIFVGGTIGMILRALSTRTLDQLEEGTLPWHKSIRTHLGLKETQNIPGIIWIRVLSAIIIWGSLLLILARISGYSASLYPLIRNMFISGFTIGKIIIIPLHIVWAILTLITVLIISHIIQQVLANQWLNKAHINQGSSDAIIKIINYIGITLAIILALSTLGVNLTNLAVIAGALSVGIGFGLQNIVNNFMSGLILLFERPIRRGDWIVSGTTEGIVKSINIRATVIQTFDHADIIIPNAELISAHVTNWMLSNQIGRIRIPISVAYGSDTSKVKDILQQIGDDNPNIFNKNYHKLSPTVLFMGFGSSSLNFELRCFLRNIQDRLVTISDINFAIDAAFREANIEIPFPQQDIHIRPEKTAAPKP